MAEPLPGELFEDAGALSAHLRGVRGRGSRVILVPTMGDLHRGHLSLVEAAAEFGHVVVSIFVNPTQFGPGEDFEAYPRDLGADRRKLAELGLSHCVFAPKVEELYDPDAATWVSVEGLSEPLCGQHRPGHFRGVTTVVAKLFGLVQADVAVFGEKDAQQCLLIERMVRDLRMPLLLLFAPTVREADGLAMSSRNRYLDPAQRKLATVLRGGLRAAEAALAAGERSVAAVEAIMRESMQGVDIDYAELRGLPGLEQMERATGRMLAAVAARIGKARLIDNQPLRITATGAAPVALSEEATASAVRAKLTKPGTARKVENGGSS